MTLAAFTNSDFTIPFPPMCITCHSIMYRAKHEPEEWRCIWCDEAKLAKQEQKEDNRHARPQQT
jgi:hypothetical protein